MIECRRFQNESHKHNFYETYFALLSLTLRHGLAFPHPGDIFVIEEMVRKLSKNITFALFPECFLCLFWSPSHEVHVFKTMLWLQFVISEIWWCFFCVSCIIWSVYITIWMWFVYQRLEFKHILACVWDFPTFKKVTMNVHGTRVIEPSFICIVHISRGS